MRSGIYKITCTVNGHYYIGRSMKYEERMRRHLNDLKRKSHKNQRLQACFNKYGEVSFCFELLEEITDRIEQEKREQELIDIHIDNDRCMNINRSAKTACDVPWTDERKRKISESHLGKKMPPMSVDVRRARSERMRGHVISPETRRKIAKSHEGKTLSDEHKAKISAKTAGVNNPMFGRTGKNNPNSIPLLQLDCETLEVIAEHASAAEVQRTLGHDASCVSKACKSQRKAYGYFWRYKESVTTISEESRTGDELPFQAQGVSA